MPLRFPAPVYHFPVADYRAFLVKMLSVRCQNQSTTKHRDVEWSLLQGGKEEARSQWSRCHTEKGPTVGIGWGARHILRGLASQLAFFSEVKKGHQER